MASECIAFVKKRLNVKKVMYGLFLAAVIFYTGYCIQDHANCPQIEVVINSKEINNKLPSITICSNIPIRRNGSDEEMKSSITSKIEKLIAEREFKKLSKPTAQQLLSISARKNALFVPPHIQNKSLFLDSPLLTKDNEWEILSQLSHLTPSERIQYAEFPLHFSKVTIVVNNKWISVALKEWPMHVTNNLYYGNCLTINIEKIKTYFNQTELNSTSLSIAYQHSYERNGDNNQVDMVDRYAVMVVHEPYTQPVFDSKNILKLYSKSNIFVSTTRECMASCLQNLTINYCRCQRPQFQVYNQLPMCRGCNVIPQWELDACNCKPPCKFSKFGLQIETLKKMSSKTNMTAWRNALYYHLLKNHTVNYMTISFGKTLFSAEVTIALPYQSVSVRKIESTCKIEIILSQVGGFLGTYAGLSILVIVNFIYENGLKLLQHCKRTKENVSSNKNGQLRKEKEPTNGLFKTIVNYIKISNLPTKFIWIVIVIVGFYKTFDQGYQLIDDYYRYPVVQKVETIEGIQFPSVTVCSNSILVKNSTTPEKEMVLKKFYEIIKDLPRNTDKDVYSTLMGYIQSLPVEIKKKLGPSLENYIKNCHYKAGNEWHNCSYQSLYEHYIDLFGNCVTFNPGFLNETLNNEFKPTELTMELQYNIQEFIEYMYGFGLLIIFQPKGTSPNLYQSGKTIFIYPGDHYSIKYSTVAIDHLPPPYPSDCVTTVTSTMLWKNNYYTHNSQYNYHHESCLSSGNYNYSAKINAGLLELHRGRINPKFAEIMDDGCQITCSTVRHYVENYAGMVVMFYIN
ncbi:hypothetical protein CHUAL_006999 [Chamberlinius hualienensis]